MGMNLQNHLIQDDSRIWSNSGLFEDTSIEETSIYMEIWGDR
jgi:hypothetical protein